MTGADVKKLPAHIWTDSLTVEKSSIVKFNTDVRANVLNIRSTKIEQLPKDLRVNTLIVDTKTAKTLPLTTLRQCGEIVMDDMTYGERRVGADFEFCSVSTEYAAV